jgi:hypothetical protein
MHSGWPARVRQRWCMRMRRVSCYARRYVDGKTLMQACACAPPGYGMEGHSSGCPVMHGASQGAASQALAASADSIACSVKAGAARTEAIAQERSSRAPDPPALMRAPRAPVYPLSHSTAQQRTHPNTPQYIMHVILSQPDTSSPTAASTVKVTMPDTKSSVMVRPVTPARVLRPCMCLHSTATRRGPAHQPSA